MSKDDPVRAPRAVRLGDGSVYTPVDFKDEAELRDFIHKHPNFVCPSIIDADFVGPMHSLGTEVRTDYSRRIDNLFVTASGHLVLTECKLARGTALSTMAAQLLLYAAEVNVEKNFESFVRARVKRARFESLYDDIAKLGYFKGEPAKAARKARGWANQYFEERSPGLLLVTDSMSCHHSRDELRTVLAMLRHHYRIAHVEVTKLQDPDGNTMVVAAPLMDRGDRKLDEKAVAQRSLWTNFFWAGQASKPKRAQQETVLKIRNVLEQAQATFVVSDEQYIMNCRFKKPKGGYLTPCYFELWEKRKKEHLSFCFYLHKPILELVGKSYDEIKTKVLSKSMEEGSTAYYDLLTLGEDELDEITTMIGLIEQALQA